MAADDAFLNDVADSLSQLPGAIGVALGGSRAQGTSRPNSDWDFSIYYRGTFDPDHVRALGWHGQTTDLGGWGPLFNGGGAFTVHGRQIDIHYRDLNRIATIQDAAERGDFDVEPLLFHQAGIPSYILLAELAPSDKEPAPAFKVKLDGPPCPTCGFKIRTSVPPPFCDFARE